MANIRFFYENRWDDFTITQSTEHANFPKENTQHRDFNKMWHSRHGAGSGWGRFQITTGANDKIDFQEGGGALAATLTQAGYSVATLCSEIKTQMESAGGYTYTIEYLETTNKFKITASSTPFSLLCNTGANKATAAWDTLGFDDSSDKTGTDNYTADELRIHSYEYLKEDLVLTNLTTCAVIVLGHNINIGGSGKIDAQFSADNFATIGLTQQLSGNTKILFYVWAGGAEPVYRYFQLKITDIDNSDGYVKAGRVFAGDQFQPTENYLNEGDVERIDPSIVFQSEAGQESTAQHDHYDSWSYVFRVKGSTQKGCFDAMFDAVGTSKPLFICEDSAIPTTPKYIRFTGWKWKPIRRDTDLWWLTIGVKEMR